MPILWLGKFRFGAEAICKSLPALREEPKARELRPKGLMYIIPQFWADRRNDLKLAKQA